MTNENRQDNHRTHRLDHLDHQASDPKPRSWEWEHTQQELDHLRGRTGRLRTLVLVLLLALVGAAAYGYFAMQKHSIQLSELPSVQESLTLLSERMNAAETQLRVWTADWDKLQTRLQTLEGRVGHTLARVRDSARKQAQELTSQLQARIDAQLRERDQVLEARFNRLQAELQADRAQLAELQAELSAVQGDTDRDLALLHRQVQRGASDLNELAGKLDRRRVDFELAEDRTRELAPGIALRITSTKVSHQRVKGWLWLMPDRRTLWIRDLGANQALTFYHYHSDEPNQLVISRVTADGVAGYLLLPAGNATAQAAASQPSAFGPAPAAD